MAADQDNTEILPLLDDNVPFFDVVMRGYDKRQVDAYIERLAEDLADVNRSRDRALATSADRAAQLANREAQIESLRRQAAESTEGIDAASLSERIREMLQLATDEAAQTRRATAEEADRLLTTARHDADQLRADSAAEIAQLTQAATQRLAEAEQRLAQARVQAATELENSRAEAARITAAAQQLMIDAETSRNAMDDAAALARTHADADASAARDAADAVAAQRRALADEDFDITLRTRRTHASEEAAADLARTQANTQAVVDEAARRVAELSHRRDTLLASLKDISHDVAQIIATAPVIGDSAQ